MEFEIEGGWRDPVQLIARYPGYHIGSGKDGVWGLQDGKMHCSWLVCCDGLLGGRWVGDGICFGVHLMATEYRGCGFCLFSQRDTLFYVALRDIW